MTSSISSVNASSRRWRNGMIGIVPLADFRPVVVTGRMSRPSAPKAFTNGGSVCSTENTSGRAA